MAKLGPVGFWLAQVPHMDLPSRSAIVLKPMIFVIELLGLCIKHFILAMRLLANMMAGHLVLAVILAFIAASAVEHRLVCRHAGQRAGRGGAQPAGVVRGVFAGVHLHVFVGLCSSAWPCTRTSGASICGRIRTNAIHHTFTHYRRLDQ